MKNKIIALLIFVLAFSYSCAYAADVPEYVRVGLSAYKNAENVTVSNNKIAIGYETYGNFIQKASLSSQNGFIVKIIYEYFARISQPLNSYDEAVSLVNEFKRNGFNALPGISAGGVFNVYVGGYTSEAEAQKVVTSLALAASVAAPTDYRVMIAMGSTNVLMYDFQSPLQIKAEDGIGLSIGSSSYRDRLEFLRTGGKKINLINVLKMQEYLYSVVASEMYSSFPIEALKAQAVAARTYAAGKKSSHASEGYDVCDTVHCQAYKGLKGEAASTVRAVDETGSLAIYYDDKLIEALFFASSGGMTENSENVWGNALPYLRAVPEINEHSGKVWTRTFTSAELSNVLKSKSVSIGTVTGMRIEEVSPSGRIISLTFLGQNGNYNVKRDAIRTFFSASTGGSLDSTLFTINGLSANAQTPAPAASSNVSITSSGQTIQTLLDGSIVISDNGTSVINGGSVSVISSQGVSQIASAAAASGGSNGAGPVQINGSTFTFSGRGWGHGAGMSQEGARGMAESGYSFTDILNYYYTGITIR